MTSWHLSRTSEYSVLLGNEVRKFLISFRTRGVRMSHKQAKPIKFNFQNTAHTTVVSQNFIPIEGLVCGNCVSTYD